MKATYPVAVAKDFEIPAGLFNMVLSLTQSPNVTQLAYHDTFTAYKVAAMIGRAFYRHGKHIAQLGSLPLCIVVKSDIATLKPQL